MQQICRRISNEITCGSLNLLHFYNFFELVFLKYFSELLQINLLLNKIELNLFKLDSKIFPLFPTFYGLYM